MAVKSAQLAVATGATPTALVAVDSSEDTIGDSYLLSNVGTVTVYVGGSDVSTSNGFRLTPGQVMGADVGSGETLYAVVSGGSAGAVDVLRTK